MCSFYLPYDSISLEAVVVRIVSQQKTTILLYLILVENNEVRVAIISEVDRNEIIKLKAWVASIDICSDKVDRILS